MNTVDLNIPTDPVERARIAEQNRPVPFQWRHEQLLLALARCMEADMTVQKDERLFALRMALRPFLTENGE